MQKKVLRFQSGSARLEEREAPERGAVLLAVADQAEAQALRQQVDVGRDVALELEHGRVLALGLAALGAREARAQANAEQPLHDRVRARALWVLALTSLP